MSRMPDQPAFAVAQPTQEPYAKGMLDVGDGHCLAYELCGQPSGLPMLFLHGGPGGWCTSRHRQLFDLSRYNVVFFDQRGCGRSQAQDSLHCNTSAHLVADIEHLRQHLDIERWLVVGGSWGAGLALAYAAAHPRACLGLVLRGVFLGRASDLHWFFQDLAQLLPDAWQALAQHAPACADAHTDMLHWLAERLLQGTPEQALAAACAWETWESAVTERRPVAPRPALPTGPEARALLNKYRVQSHYLVHACFWAEPGLLAQAALLRDLPTAILHGRLDWVCRPQAAWDLHQALPGSRLHILDACGHSPFETPMARALADALALFAREGHFKAWGQGATSLLAP